MKKVSNSHRTSIIELGPLKEPPSDRRQRSNLTNLENKIIRRTIYDKERLNKLGVKGAIDLANILKKKQSPRTSESLELALQQQENEGSKQTLPEIEDAKRLKLGMTQSSWNHASAFIGTPQHNRSILETGGSLDRIEADRTPAG